MNRKEFIKKLEQLDFSPLENDLPAVAFLMRCASDYGYVEQISWGKINAENDARMKVAGQILKKGVEFIPVVGDILTMIADLGGIDFGALGSISDSGTARQRLIEWINFINTNYTKNQYGIQDLPILNKAFIKETNLYINARPKCMSPTSGCSKEHQQYIARTSLLKESQQALYDIYYNYCVNDFVFASWLQGVKNYGSIKNPDVQQVQSQTSKAGLIALVGLGLLFSKKF